MDALFFVDIYISGKETLSSELFHHLNKTTMGIFWDLIQQEQIEDQKEKSASLEDRVGMLEEQLAKTHALLIKTLHVLEKHLNQDIDMDGKIG